MLIKTCPVRKDTKIAYPEATVRITSGWGQGTLVYATNDGWLGIKLDGSESIDEYPAEFVAIEK